MPQPRSTEDRTYTLREASETFDIPLDTIRKRAQRPESRTGLQTIKGDRKNAPSRVTHAEMTRVFGTATNNTEPEFLELARTAVELDAKATQARQEANRLEAEARAAADKAAEAARSFAEARGR